MQRELWSSTAHAWPCSESLILMEKFSFHFALASYLFISQGDLWDDVSLAVCRLKLKTESKNQHIQQGSMQMNPCHINSSSSPLKSPSLALFFLVSQLPGEKVALNLPICFTLAHPAAPSSFQLCCVWGDRRSWCVYCPKNGIAHFCSLCGLLVNQRCCMAQGVCGATQEQ